MSKKIKRTSKKLIKLVKNVGVETVILGALAVTEPELALPAAGAIALKKFLERERKKQKNKNKLSKNEFR